MDITSKPPEIPKICDSDIFSRDKAPYTETVMHMTL